MVSSLKEVTKIDEDIVRLSHKEEYFLSRLERGTEIKTGLLTQVKESEQAKLRKSIIVEIRNEIRRSSWINTRILSTYQRIKEALEKVVFPEIVSVGANREKEEVIKEISASEECFKQIESNLREQRATVDMLGTHPVSSNLDGTLKQLVENEGNILKERKRVSSREYWQQFYMKKLSNYLRAKIDLSLGKIRNTPPFTEYFLEKGPYLAGIIMMHGLGGKRFDLHFTARLLAAKRYYAIVIDIPGHYDNRRVFSMYMMSQNIMTLVKALRKRKDIERVCVLGHSMGAVGTMLAAFGYDMNTENKIEELWQKYLEDKQNEDVSKEIVTQLQDITMQSIKNNVMGMPDAIILTAPPLDFLSVAPKFVMNLLPKTDDRLGHIFLKNTILRDKQGSRKEHLAEYFKNAIVPTEYLGMLSYFKDSNLIIKNALEYYHQIPKLVMWGAGDILTRPFLGNKGKLIDEFTKIGAETIIMPNTGHWMAKKGFEMDAIDALLIDELNIRIIEFLGKKVVRQAASSQSSQQSTSWA